MNNSIFASVIQYDGNKSGFVSEVGTNLWDRSCAIWIVMLLTRLPLFAISLYSKLSNEFIISSVGACIHESWHSSSFWHLSLLSAPHMPRLPWTFETKECMRFVNAFYFSMFSDYSYGCFELSKAEYDLSNPPLECFFNSISKWKFICPIPDITSYPERVLRDIIIWHGCQPNDDAALNEGIRVIRNISELLYHKQVTRAGTSNYINKLITHIYISRSPWLSVVIFISL